MSAKSYNECVSTSTVAAFLGISTVAFNDLVGRGVVRRGGRAGYPLMQTVAACCEHWRRQASGRAAEPGQERILSEARARATTAQAQEREFRVAVLRGNYVSARAVTFVVGSYVSAIRERLLSLPGALAMMLAHRNAEEIDSALTDAIFETLDNFSQSKICEDVAARNREGGRPHARTNASDDIDGVGLEA
jgi:phage terminase Nu1 subunit (DNA packaging protein)